MISNPLARSALLMLTIVVITIACWEIHLRSIGVSAASYDDGGPLWADKRAMVYEPSDKATVFIGSSRIKYDLDIPTWENITGDHAIQLACVGSNPIPVLLNLADDADFKGKLVIDVTEFLFFSPLDGGSAPDRYIDYYKKRTPSQRASFQINHLFESQLAFLDKDNFSLNAYLDKLPLKNREGVHGGPDFPWQFETVSFDRQSAMNPEFVADTNLQNKVKGIWRFFRSMDKEPPVSGAKLDSIFIMVKTAVNKIKARGGQVIFSRTPSSGEFWQIEQMGFPREKYWDRLLKETACNGIFFADYPAINHFICPETSHLKPQDAIAFTKEFIRILEEEKGWKFQKTLMAAN